VNDPVRHTPEETWRLEFQSFRGAPHKKKPIHLRDGTTVQVGARYDEEGYYVTEGKQRHHSTVSLFMCAGLDGVETVRRDARDRQLVTVVMAGERLASEGAGEPLRAQYDSCYDEYMARRTAQKLLRATDAFYALVKKEEIYPGFADEELVALASAVASGGPPLDREYLQRSVLGGGPALVEEILAALASGAPRPEEELSRLLRRVRLFGEDVAAYERAVAGDLSRARADLELARRAVLRLLVGDEGSREGGGKDDRGPGFPTRTTKGAREP
jgi:hypothetical protein